jgi:SAM-dependent methyltransferase
MIRESNDATWNDLHMIPDGWYPNEFLVRFLAKYVRKRTGLASYQVKRPDVRRILDLGCGIGRHVVMLAQEGYDTAGIDIAHNAVRFAEKWLQTLGLTADLRIGSIIRLPWPDNHFDAIVSHGVLDHMTPDEGRAAVQEARRVLKPGGLFYLSLASTDEYSCGRGGKVDVDTFRLTEGDEAGLIQRFFSLESVNALLSGFDIQDVVYDCWQPVQGRGFSALDVNDFGKLARFHIAASSLKAS